MTSLAAFQQDFLTLITCSDELEKPVTASRWELGISVYRNNYRSALMEAIGQTYERTAKWVGTDSFRQAAAHHLILNPPSGWTLDDVGEGFERTLHDLFPGDPEVSELAWLEWSMHYVFSAPDATPLTTDRFAELVAEFDDSDWQGLRLEFMPRLSTREVYYNLAGLWRDLEAQAEHDALERFHEPRSCHVVREGEQPVFFLAERGESVLINDLKAGKTFGEVCSDLSEVTSAEEATLRAGAALGRWLSMGLIRGIRSGQFIHASVGRVRQKG
jgi:hypothetical protein